MAGLAIKAAIGRVLELGGRPPHFYTTRESAKSTITTSVGVMETSRMALKTRATEVSQALRLFGPRGWFVAALGTAAALLFIGIPAAILNSPFFIRMIPVRGQDYVIWIASALLVGLIAGTYASRAPSDNEGKVFSGGMLSFLAVGCPICNKLVVLMLGTSGALTFFGPAQLYIGLASLGLLGWTFSLRARSVAGACPLPSS